MNVPPILDLLLRLEWIAAGYVCFVQSPNSYNMLGVPLHLVPQDTYPFDFKFNDVPRLDPLIKLHTRTKAYGSGTDELPRVDWIVL